MNVKLKVISIFLLLSFVTPLTVQALHTMGEHSHPVCMDFTTHIHKKELDCSIDLFHFSSFNFEAIKLLPSSVTVSPKETVESYYLLPYRYNQNTQSLRGPPVE